MIDFLLLETGDRLLQEDGTSFLILETAPVVPPTVGGGGGGGVTTFFPKRQPRRISASAGLVINLPVASISASLRRRLSASATLAIPRVDLAAVAFDKTLPEREAAWLRALLDTPGT